MPRRLKNLNRHFIDRAVADFARRLAGWAPGSAVLDVGAGSGHYRGLFNVNRYIALDRGLEQGERRGLDVVADVMQLPYAADSVDHAMCVEVLEHVREPDLLLIEIHRVLKPAGRLLLTTPLCYGEHMVPFDFFRFTRYGLEALLQRAGFRPTRIEPRGGYFALIAYLLARVPDQLLRGHSRRSWRRALKPVLRLLLTFGLAPIFLLCDRLDRERRVTLGYVCEAQKV